MMSFAEKARLAEVKKLSFLLLSSGCKLRKYDSNSQQTMVESMGDTIPRTSQLDLGVRVSPHPAPDVLSFRFCSCVDNRGSFREPLEGC